MSDQTAEDDLHYFARELVVVARRWRTRLDERLKCLGLTEARWAALYWLWQSPDGLSQTALAVAVRVPPRRINEIVLGKRAVTADTDLRLTRYFGLTPGFFLGLQGDHDLMARRRELGADLEAIKPRAA